MIAGYHGPRELQSNFYLQPEEFAFICVGKAHHANSQNRFIQLFLEKEAVCVDIWGLSANQDKLSETFTLGHGLLVSEMVA